MLLLPSATYRAAAFLAAAARMGVDIVVGSDEPQALASVMGDHFCEMDFADPAAAARAIEELAGRLPLDAVVAVDDAGAIVASHAMELLGIGQNPTDAVRATRDKSVMRTLLAAAHVPQPEFRTVDGSAGEAQRAAQAASELGAPVVIKPCSLSGSRGVIRADDLPGVEAAAQRVRAIATAAGIGPSEPLLVERFVPGAEVAVEGVLHQGVLTVLAIFDKPDPLDGPYFEETIYITPTTLDEATQARCRRVVAQAVAALGLIAGPIHAELRLSGSQPVLIEIAARTIGGRCSKTLRFDDASSLEEIVLAEALGRAPSTHQHRQASGVMMIPVPASGRLLGVEGVEAALAVNLVSSVEITIPPGRMVLALPEGDRYLGFIFARGDTSDHVEHALRLAHGRLDVAIDTTVDEDDHRAGP